MSFWREESKGRFFTMNTLKYHKKYQEEKEAKEFVERLKKEQEYYDSLSPEEKVEYDKKKEEERKRINESLSIPALVNNMTKQDYDF